MDGAKEEDGDKGKRKEREYMRENCTDCAICLHDIPLIVSWVHLLAGETLFGSQSSCQAMRKARPLQTARQTDQQTDTCPDPELSNPSPLS